MELAELFCDSLNLIILVLLPVVLVAGGTSLIISMLATRLGLQDPVVTLIFRTAGIVIFLLFMGGGLFDSLQQWSTTLWNKLTEVEYSQNKPIAKTP